MTLTAFFLVFVSVFLHVTWNFLSKKISPSGAFYLILTCTASVLWSGFFFFSEFNYGVLPWTFWLTLAGSILFEGIYFIGLAHAYRSSDISMAYPMGRALPVLLTAAVTVILGLGSVPGRLAVAGMVITFTGCIMLPLKSIRGFSLKIYFHHTFLFISLIAVGTTGYTILDSIAMGILRESDAASGPLQTFCYLFMLEFGIALFLFFFVITQKKERKEFRRLFLRSPYPMVAGVCSSSAYALILIAMKYVTNISFIQVFRQMSLPLGVLAGVLFLKESCPPVKIAGVVLIVLGLILTVF